MCLGYGREKLVRVYNLQGEELFSVSIFHRCRWMTILTGGVVAVADERAVTLLNIDWNNGCVESEKTKHLVCIISYLGRTGKVQKRRVE